MSNTPPNWPKHWPVRSMIYMEGFQAGYDAQMAGTAEVVVPYVDSQADAYIAGVYHGRTEALASSQARPEEKPHG